MSPPPYPLDKKYYWLLCSQQIVRCDQVNMSSFLAHALVALLVWPLFIPFGAIVSVLYRLYPLGLVTAFSRYSTTPVCFFNNI